MSQGGAEVALSLLARAAIDGPASLPTALQQALGALRSGAESSLDTASTRKHIDDEFSVWAATAGGMKRTEHEVATCERAIRGILFALADWTTDLVHPWHHLQALLAAFDTFQVVLDGAGEPNPALLQGRTLTAGLRSLLDRLWAQDGSPLPWEDLGWEATRALARDGDLPQLARGVRRIPLPRSRDAAFAMYLLWRVDPRLLGDFVDHHRDPILSSVVVETIGRWPAIRLTSHVDDATFKFLCALAIADEPQASVPSGVPELLRDLTLQAATSVCWVPWLRVFYSQPNGDTISALALALASPHLEISHWFALVEALSLKLGLLEAQTVASALLPCLEGIDEGCAKSLCALAFQRWDRWNYGANGQSIPLLSPAASSADVLVVKHCAWEPPGVIAAHIEKLQAEIDCIDMYWAASEDDLVSRRNRLLSRLRLLKHAQKIVLGETDESLPPPLTHNGSYSKVRYKFIDVDSVMPHSSRVD